VRSWLVPAAVLLFAPFAAGASRAGESPRTVSFATADSGTVVADLYGSGGRAVVLAHGAVFDKESWAPLADSLAARGLRALAIDFRGYGGSKAGTKARGLDEDVLAAVRWLHAHGAKSVSVLGASMGGGASGRAATEAKPGEIDRLALLSPVSIEHPEQLKAATILYVASRDERMAPGIREQYAKAPEPKRLVLIDGDVHAQNIFRTDQGPRLTQVLLDFLAGETPPAGECPAPIRTRPPPPPRRRGSSP
jgi:dienelactone hydrolase